MVRRRKSRKKARARYLSPGVYVEEVSSGSRPLEGVGTAVAAFVQVVRHRPKRAVAVVVAAVVAVVAAVRSRLD